MSVKKFFPLRLSSLSDLAIAVRDLAQLFNNLVSDHETLVTTVGEVKDEVTAGTGTGTTTIDDVSSSAHGLAPRSPGDITKFLNGDHTPDYAQVKGSDLLLADVTVNDVTSATHGFAPKSPADVTKFLNGAATPAYALVKGSDLSLSDVLTNNVSIAQHGFAPKLPNDVTKFLDGTGGYSVPGGSTFPPVLGTFPAISNLELRLSAELSTMTINTDGYVAQINDMSGNWGSNFVASGGTGARPRLVHRGMAHMRPGLVFDGATAKLVAGATRTLAQPFTTVLVLMNWKAGTTADLFRDAGFGPTMFQGTNDWSMTAGTTIADSNLYSQNNKQIPDGDIAAPAVAMAVFNGASSAIYNNGVASTVTSAGALGLSGLLYVGGNPSAYSHLLLYEMLIFSKALNSTERGQLNSYYAAALELYL